MYIKTYGILYFHLMASACLGLYKEPKWGHLRDLHHALRLCRKGLLWGSYSVQHVGNGFDVRICKYPYQLKFFFFCHGRFFFSSDN